MEHYEIRDRISAAIVFPGGMFVLIWLVAGADESIRVFPLAVVIALLMLVKVAGEVATGWLLRSVTGQRLRITYLMAQRLMRIGSYLLFALLLIALFQVVDTEKLPATLEQSFGTAPPSRDDHPPTSDSETY